MAARAIQTRYKGCRFRARLEARWAVLFDSLGVKWEYEVEGYELPSGRYLPDFWLPDKRLWLEIKGKLPTRDEINRIFELGEATGNAAYILVGMPKPNEKLTYVVGVSLVGAGIEVPLPPNTPIRSLLSAPGREERGLPLRCPICRDTYIHIDNAINIPGNDEKSVLIPMSCESGHIWTVRYNFYKGITYYEVSNFLISNMPPDLYVADGDAARLAQSYEAALSARFEHGESPNLPPSQP